MLVITISYSTWDPNLATAHLSEGEFSVSSPSGLLHILHSIKAKNAYQLYSTVLLFEFLSLASILFSKLNNMVIDSLIYWKTYNPVIFFFSTLQLFRLNKILAKKAILQSFKFTSCIINSSARLTYHLLAVTGPSSAL